MQASRTITVYLFICKKYNSNTIPYTGRVKAWLQEEKKDLYIVKIAIYARVSTIDKGQDVDLQLNDLRAYAQARGWRIYHEYVDKGQSGGKERRPSLDALMDDCRKRRIDAILVWRLDRLGRSLRHLVNTLEELKHLGVSFISFKENLDFTTSTGQLMFHLLAAFAQFEKDLIKERVIAGLANARSKGKKLGRPGKELDPDKVRELKQTGKSIREIARALGVSTTPILKILRS